MTVRHSPFGPAAVPAARVGAFTRAAVVTLLLALALVLPAAAAEPALRDFVPVQDGFVPRADPVPTYAPDHLLIQLSADALKQATFAVPADKGGVVAGARTGLGTLDALLARAGATGLERAFVNPADKAAGASLGAERWYLASVPVGTDLPSLAAELAADPGLEAVSLDYYFFPAVVPNDPNQPANWGHNNTAQLPGYGWGTTWDHTLAGVGTVGFDSNTQVAWNGTQGYGNSSVVIAILDTGVDTAHNDILRVTGYDYGSNDSNPHDDSSAAGHGTCCAGVAAGIANNGIGSAGAAGACSIMPLKIANNAGSLSLTAATNALYYAADHGAKVVSMSFGAAISSNAAMDAAITYANNAGVIMFAATGNENASTISYPAINATVIGVGAASPCGDRKRSSSSTADLNPGVSADPRGYTCDGERWWGSNYGTNTQNAAGAVDLIAPTILPTTDITGAGGYTSNDIEPFFNGTSCATPYAAGVAALVISQNPTWTPAQVKARLTSTAIDIVNVESVAGWDRYSGYGMVDAQAAVGASATPAPVAAFTTSATSGCAPLTVNFTDTTTGAVTGWAWTFGDGGTSNAQSPSHQYLAAGTYTVALTATGPGGSNTATQTNLVTVTTTPVAEFTGAPLTGTAPLTVNFTNQSTGSVTGWAWDFGDGGTSTAQSPSHQYTVPGTYTVTLTATGACGPNLRTRTAYVVVAAPAPVANFTASATSGCAPLTVDFTDATAGAVTSWAWTFGDGGTSTAQNPSHQYLAAGTYTVALTATGPGGGNTLTQVDLVTVGDVPAAGFSGSPLSGDAPLTVAFTDATTGTVTSRAWDFGDGGTSTDASPSHEYLAPGMYTVRLIATNACGPDTLTRADYVVVTAAAPVAAFTADQAAGCAPLAVGFSDASTGAVTGWAWDFGDGGTSAAANPSHEYLVAGTYTVSLTVSGPGGDDTATQADLVTVGGAPVAAFAASTLAGTAPLTVDFTDQSAGALGLAWDFGGDGTDTVANPQHTFTVPGTYAVTLVATADCGADTARVDIEVTAPGAPVAAFTRLPVRGCAPLLVGFTDQSTGLRTGRSWDFGDAATDTAAAPGHEYALPGSYDVRLVVFGPGGADTLTVAGAVIVDGPVTAAFAADVTTGPGPLVVTFTDQSAGGATAWAWDFGDGGTSTEQHPVHEFAMPGAYTVSLTATGPCGDVTTVMADLVTVTGLSGTGDVTPARFGLAQNYPNPFNPLTTISYSLERTTAVRLEVYDATGRLVDVLVDGVRAAGAYSVVWQPTERPSGVYFARLLAGEQSATMRMVLVK